MKAKTIAAALALAAGAAYAQHAGHGGHAAGTATPYAGLQSREIKALSAEDTQRLLRGEGMSLALAAELNGYPGPSHVLELGEALQLTREQREQTEALMARHKARARELGAKLLEAERALDRAFAGGKASHEEVARLATDIGRLQGELRAEHLQTHLVQKSLLAPRQVHRYQQLRGYTTAGHHGGHR